MHHPVADPVHPDPDRTHPSRSVRLLPTFSAHSLGYFALFVAAAVFLASNNSLLSGMTASIAAERRAAEEAAKPAAVEAITITSADCTGCYNVANLLTALQATPTVSVSGIRTVDVDSTEGALLVGEYQLTRVPAFIIRGEAEKALSALPRFARFGELVGSDFVGSRVPAPYRELESGTIRGTFEVTYLTEKSCSECYDPTVNRQSLARFGMTPSDEKTIDRSDSEGQKLVRQYNITTTPTIIMTGDLAAYEGFDRVWAGVGTVEPDGAYVFRTGLSQLGTYYDLTTRTVVPPPQTNTNTTPAP